MVADDAVDCCKVVGGTYTVALQQVAYQNLDMDCCVVHDGVLFRYCCVTGEQRGRRYIRRWIYERSARAATSGTETFSDRDIWNGLCIRRRSDVSAYFPGSLAGAW